MSKLWISSFRAMIATEIFRTRARWWHTAGCTAKDAQRKDPYGSSVSGIIKDDLSSISPPCQNQQQEANACLRWIHRRRAVGAPELEQGAVGTRKHHRSKRPLLARAPQQIRSSNKQKLKPRKRSLTNLDWEMRNRKMFYILSTLAWCNPATEIHWFSLTIVSKLHGSAMPTSNAS